MINSQFVPEKITQATRDCDLRRTETYVFDISTTIVILLITVFIICSAYISLHVIVLGFELCVNWMFVKNIKRQTTEYFLILPRRPV